MKTLIFFRHGKSDWDAGVGEDHLRPVNKRGKRDARRMGRFLTEIGGLPNRIVSSTAVRAQTTLELAREAGEWGEVSTELTDRLYDSTPGAVLEVIREQPDTFGRLLLVGHEPTWSTMIGRFTGESNVKVATAAMAAIEFGLTSWTEVDFGRGRLLWLVSPKILPS